MLTRKAVMYYFHREKNILSPFFGAYPTCFNSELKRWEKIALFSILYRNFLCLQCISIGIFQI